ncbi:MAG: hypothetical protein NTW06_00490 [Candidatus Falkowbacteria bacterium]|nr:hypothetical protein [Candidatus Falkowbacteria bacterium]
MPKELSLEELMKNVHRVLETPFWIPELSSETIYSRLHDDHDGTLEGRVSIEFNRHGDAWIDIDTRSGPALRFRTLGGGGRSPRTRNALMLLALAMKLDNEEKPDPD